MKFGRGPSTRVPISYKQANLGRTGGIILRQKLLQSPLQEQFCPLVVAGSKIVDGRALRYLAKHRLALHPVDGTEQREYLRRFLPKVLLTSTHANAKQPQQQRENRALRLCSLQTQTLSLVSKG